MSGPRIGDKGHGARPATATAGDRRLATRAGEVLGSPLGVLIVVPALVLLVGVVATVIGQTAISQSSVALARDQMSARNLIVARQIRNALAQSDVLIERLSTVVADHDPKKPFDAVAFAMRDLMSGRSGVAYLSVSFPDGTFQGAYVHEDQSLRFQDSRVEKEGTRVRRFGTEGRSQLSLLSEERTTYDPRQRGFYKLAAASPGPVWTKPYPFFMTHYTGITRAKALRTPSGEIQAVLTVDFDVNRISEFLDRIPLGASRVLLFADDGTLLGDPAAAAHIRTLPAPSDRPLSYRDLKDPTLDAFFANRASKSETFSAEGRGFLTIETPVGSGLDWHAASFVPEDVLLASATAYRRRAALVAFAAVVLALAVAVIFSRHVVRMRKQTADARAAATKAAAEAKDLGSYRLTEKIGAGGMGEVWCAEHRLLAREAAIKLIRSESAPTPEAQERFRREAQTLASLRSRNTIELFDFGITDDGTFFYVMELLDGMDFETLVERYGPPPPSRVISLIAQACNSLAEAHEAGLVHRDIKPANLYVCRQADEVDVLKVLDFGLVRGPAEAPPAEGRSLEELARELESDSAQQAKLTAAGAVLGTPDYMAPEQILGLEIDGRTDVYALGIVLYFGLCGALPFPTRRDAMATMVAHLQNEPENLSKKVKSPLPTGLVELVMRCLAKRREDRPASALVLRRELVAIAREHCKPWTEDEASKWWSQNVPRRIGSLSPPGGEASLAPTMQVKAPTIA